MPEQRSAAKVFRWEAALLALAVAGAAIASIRPGAIAARRSSVADREEARGDSAALLGVRPVIRPHIAIPLGGEAARLFRDGCALQAMAHGNYYEPDSATAVVVVADSFGVRSALSDRPDSAVYEGTVTGADGTLWTWHCTVPATWNSSRIGEIRSERELPWPGTEPRFELVRALSDAAAKECATRAFRLWKEYALRGQRVARGADTLIVTGDAFPLYNDIVRQYRCTAVIRNGGVASLNAVEVK
ncbi:MAG TPA: hypothetical protein VHM67_01140 [Gemmatimonadaceae bacterium]|nr:hypothetical protein [Gemmatimonadaceae bacterium]